MANVKGFRPGSKSWKNFMAKLYGIGAAVVIVGALFKIMHWPGANEMLILGLGTEAIIFIFSAFEPIHAEYDWSLVYKQFRQDEMELNLEEDAAVSWDDLDGALDKAKITPELLENLGEGMRTLSGQARKLNDISDASVATNEYVSSIKGATEKVSHLSEAYVNASESLASLQDTEFSGKTAGESLKKLTSNLNKLNEAYELQLSGSVDHLKASNQAFEGIDELLKNLRESVEDTKRYKENISELSTNLSSLNTVYGNMLNAMNYTKG
jgi:gliding motility-associated protein GldL